LIETLEYALYFLTVDSIVRFARSQDILCQGRGSAANSAVCYVLGITSIDPERNDLLFEHFVSEERREPPDIDVDFEHDRREIVMQWVFEHHGRDHAALCSTVIPYRARGALRDVSKALGLPEDLLRSLSAQISGWSQAGFDLEQVAGEVNFNLGEASAPRRSHRPSLRFLKDMRGELGWSLLERLRSGGPTRAGRSGWPWPSMPIGLHRNSRQFRRQFAPYSSLASIIAKFTFCLMLMPLGRRWPKSLVQNLLARMGEGQCRNLV
jgi:hypothetical protein